MTFVSSYMLVRDGLPPRNAPKFKDVEIEMEPSTDPRIIAFGKMTKRLWLSQTFYVEGQNFTPKAVCEDSQLHPVFDDPAIFQQKMIAMQSWTSARRYRSIYMAGRIRNVRIFDVLLSYDLTDESDIRSISTSGKIRVCSQEVIQTLELKQLLPNDPDAFVHNICVVFRFQRRAKASDYW